MSRHLALGLVALSLTSASLARADLPPPPGRSRVSYAFRIDKAVEGRTVIAFPIYNTKDNDTHVVVMDPGTDVSPFQGWTPGLYSLASADMANLPKDDAAVTAYLAAHGHVCLKRVPRVFEVPTITGVEKLTDVIHVTDGASACEATLAKSIYGGPGGKTGEGGADETGHRTPPPPFGKELPTIADAGFAHASSDTPPSTPSAAPSAAPTEAPTDAGPPTSTEPHGGGCAGCAVSGKTSLSGALVAAVLVGLALLRRRR